MVALPPSITGQPSAGFSQATQPSGNPGAVAQAMAQVREAINILQMSLPSLPVGSPLHKSVVSAISSLSKNAPEEQAQPGIQQNVIKNLAAQAQQQAPMIAMMRSMGAGAPQSPQGAGGMEAPMGAAGGMGGAQ